MKTEVINVANLKCSGCANTIQNELLKIKGVQQVTVQVEDDQVTVSYEGAQRETLINKLHSLGYPEATEKNGLLLQLKSYASCMMGRMDK